MAERVRFRIGRTCSCVARSLPVVEEYAIWQGVIKEEIDLFQLGYRTSVEASKGTHARGGCVDAGNISQEMTEIWRMFGWTMQPRYLRGIVPHYHGWPYGCPHLSGAARDQEDDWDRKDSGLVGTARVTGPYPVLRWDVALERMEKKMAKTLDQMKAEILAEIRKELNALPEDVWQADAVPNPFDTAETNEFVQPGTVFKRMLNALGRLETKSNRQEKTLNALVEEVRGKVPTP